MGTKPQDVTEIRFLTAQDIMELTGRSYSWASKKIMLINQEQKKKGKLVLKGKVNAAVFMALL